MLTCFMFLFFSKIYIDIHMNTHMYTCILFILNYNSNFFSRSILKSKNNLIVSTMIDLSFLDELKRMNKRQVKCLFFIIL